MRHMRPLIALSLAGLMTLSACGEDVAAKDDSAAGSSAAGGSNNSSGGIDPTGNYLIAGNHGSNDIFTFKIDQATGRLTAVGERVEVPSPVCHKFIPAF